MSLSPLFLVILSVSAALAKHHSPLVQTIIDNAWKDNIDLPSLPFASAALASIDAISQPISTSNISFIDASRIDTHVHVVPDFYRALVPYTGGSPTPSWDVESHLAFMAQNSVKRGIVAISAPGSGVFPGNVAYSIGLARLLNEWVAALVRAYPERFGFYAVMPLPYSSAAVAEARFALEKLGAKGVALLSNHEGLYLGNAAMRPFFAGLNGLRNTSKEVVYVHPTEPVLRLGNGTSISANPTLYASGLVEFYFETARTIMDLTLSQTIHNYTKLNFVIPHVGGAFPAIEDRFIKSFPALEMQSKAIYNTRFFWDSAGPVYYDQVLGLLGYNISTTRLTFGTDYPYAPIYTYAGSIGAILNAAFLSAADRERIFTTDAEKLFDGV